MSELKAYIAPTPDGTGLADYYLKSEADAVIAEKDKEIADLIEKNKRLAHKDIIMASETIKDVFKELRHQKYKRCLDKAKWCYSMDCRMLDEASDNGTFFKESWCWKRASWYGKWKRKWLELAEQFKGAE